MTVRVLIVDPDPSLRESLQLVLCAEEFAVFTAESGDQALATVERTPPDVVLCDVSIPGPGGRELVPMIKGRCPDAAVVVTSDGQGEELALEAVNLAAHAYLKKPFQPGEALFVLRTAREREQLRATNRQLHRDLDRAVGNRAIVAASQEMIDVLEDMERIAGHDAPVLITGEPGTGKEGLARAIHAQSSRRDGPFVVADCAATPDEELASALFGHTLGGVRGNGHSRRGLVMDASGGTLLLDRVEAATPAIQERVARVLRDGEVWIRGEPKSRPVDVRVVATTPLDLSADVPAGRIREELLDRLASAHLPVPPLRRRRRDIPLLVDHYLGESTRALGSRLQGVSDDALALLAAYSWPGNIRELQNVVERAALLARGDRVTSVELPRRIRETEPSGGVMPARDFSLKRSRRKLEAEVITQALKTTGGNRTHAARLLEISHRGLLYKIKEYGLN